MTLATTVFVIFGLVIYFAPFINAIENNHRNKSAIFALNLLLGWTFLGWVGALVWSIMKPTKV